MTEPLYTAEALSTGGGRNGHVRTSDGILDLDLEFPVALGGLGRGANPELLFAAGYAACFHSALHLVARQHKVHLVDSTVGSRVDLLPNAAGGFELAVHLEVVLPDIDPSMAHLLADAAHRACPYSNAVMGNIRVEVSVSDD
ncbi:organic hydroperoxide resistance protein [Rathayibacter sp. SD072]|uniref:organic hydroperoxide resistance protein n=1 Tax=Rathayibacter sp. SD072 TaxID=2781731 RepID=UPI001A96EB8C|nr:organic hydroperoxide resistance protein [Rathayibacter sp. SD072]MBO0982610.1 organic hydroperoxide resistance protein [Rathayibacter sp. SD072]